MKIRIASAFLCAFTGVALVSCGGGGGSNDAASGTEGSDSTTSTIEAAAPTFDCTEGGAGKADATLSAVPTNGGYEYGWKPAKLELPKGEKVTVEIVNKSDIYHDFTAGSCLPGRFEKGESITISFEVPDEAVEFVCSIHPQTMIGTIEPH